ncbi:GNAT family N-acetyltransferase [Thioclava sp. SK-1]|uniref:GNAT family N-acetyltransferase n=1 Tax=Thioclava sp. SK-1 TaxID=1889770 RepID=UPI0008240C0D|nr:GNAT family N-acetyltransferase [Thioclava sp. SK-1]OCX66972.1 GNAT family N-acetyltransferase [Thioclava sp. SK-1]
MIALSPTPVLETERLVLRAPAQKDWPLWRAFHQSDRSDFVRPGATFDEGQSWRSWAAVVGHWVMRGWGPFVVTQKASDRGVGLVGPWQPAGWPEAELLWTIWDAKDEGRGIMAEAASAARRYAFDVLGWPTAVSYIDEKNTRSAALAGRLGACADPEASVPAGKGQIVAWRHPALKETRV